MLSLGRMALARKARCCAATIVVIQMRVNSSGVSTGESLRNGKWMGTLALH